MKIPAAVVLRDGELRPEVGGEMRDCGEGSMSRPVRREVSERPEAVEVRARKRSRRLFCSARRTPCEFAGSVGLGVKKGGKGRGRTDLEVEDFLKVGEGLAGDEEEVVLDELLGGFLWHHDDLEEGVDLEDTLGDVARVAEEVKNVRAGVNEGSGETNVMGTGAESPGASGR